MRIGFDARMISHSGIGTYSRHLLDTLTARKDIDFTLFGDPAKIADYMAKKVVSHDPIYSLREQIFFPSLLSRHSFDLAHFPHYNVPLGYRGPFVVTVHDCIHLLYPKSRLAYIYAKTLMKSACRRARKIMTDSLHTRKDIARLLHVPEEKIAVIYPGVSENWKEKVQSLKGNDRNSGPLFSSDYALYVGNVRPLKNIELMVRAFEKIQNQNKIKLVIAGRDFMPVWTAKYKDRADIVFLGEVSESTLLRLYANAKIFVFPSLYEGFGLPPLEAMACGVPVVCSNASSLPEVVGDAAKLFDPRDEKALIDNVLSLWNDTESRRKLIEKGYANAGRFSWTKCANEVAEVYRNCMQ